MKKKLQNQIDALKKQIEKSMEYVDRSRIELERLEEELAECDKVKPKMRVKVTAPDQLTNGGLDHEITHYRKYSDEFIEFEARGCRYRYVKSYKTSAIKFPPEPGGMSCIINSKNIFEIYDFVLNKYVPVDCIKYIELIPGVDEYDKN